MSKTALDKDQLKLINQLSLERALDDIDSLFNIGEKVVGTPGELEAVKMIESRFKEIGLKNVHLEPFEIATSNHKLSELELLKPIHKKLACGQCFGTNRPGFATDAQGLAGAIVDVGFGTIRDFKRLEREGIELKDRIVLIEGNENLFYFGSGAPVAQAEEFGASAAILTSVIFERDILRNYHTEDAAIPVVSIPYIEAQAIRSLLRRGEVKANLKNIVDLNVKSISHNVVGELPGRKYPDQLIVLTAHHDSWYGAANDNASGVAAIIGVAEVLAKNYKNSRTIRFVTCGGEETSTEPGVQEVFRWLAGSYAYTKQHADELDKIVANINVDAPAYGISSNITLTQELESLTRELIEEFEAEALYEVEGAPDTGLDHWWFVRRGVPSVSIDPRMNQYMKIYHSNRDTPELINACLVRNALRMTLALVLKLDSSALLHYDFTTTAEKLHEALNERSAKLENVIDLRKLIDNVAHFKVVAERFQEKKSSALKKKLGEETMFFVNRVQREVCSSLNPKLVDIKCGMTVESAYVVPAYLDAVINLKKAIVAVKRADKETLMASLKATTERLWGLNVSPKVYAVFQRTILESQRAQGLKFDLLPEARELDNKLKKGVRDLSVEIASLEEKCEGIVERVDGKLSELNQAVVQSSSALTEAIRQLS